MPEKTGERRGQLFSSSPSNTCDNSYSPFSVEERVLKAIDESQIELTPLEIARKVHAKRSTVRVIIRKLLDKGVRASALPGGILQQNHLRVAVRSALCSQYQSSEFCV